MFSMFKSPDYYLLSLHGSIWHHIRKFNHFISILISYLTGSQESENLQSFSSENNLHCLDLSLQVYTLFKIDYLISASSTYFSSSSQIYLDDSKVLQYFGYLKHNLVALEAFADSMNIMNHTEL